MFGGSRFNIVGPTGALSGIIATFVLTSGTQGLPALAMVAGLMILVAYAFRLEQYLIFIPSSVIHGFTLGVAFIIGLNQLNAALGLKGLPQHESFFANLIESLQHLGNASGTAIGVFIIFFISLWLCRRVAPQLPGVMLLAPVGILLGFCADQGIVPVSVETLGSRFGAIDFQLFVVPQLVFSRATFEAASVVALVAILETMLSAKIADGITHTKHNERREMLGLGLANIVSGAMGGMPATAALARTSLNIKAGATDSASAVINVVGVALICAFLLQYFRFIPMPVIAAILVFVATQMALSEHYLKFWRFERSSFFVLLLVAFVTVVQDPMIGILLGATVSLLLFVRRLSRGQFDLRVNRFEEGIVDAVSGAQIDEIEENADVLLYSIRGKLCYINSRAHVARFENNLTKYKHVILRIREVYFLDTDGVEALDEIVDILESRGQEALITSIDPGVVGLLEQVSTSYHRLKSKNLVFQKSEHALQYLGIPLGV